MENSIQSNSNNQQDYSDLNLKQLKEEATKREITPEGNKSSKDTWREALKQDDQLKATVNSNNNSEVISTNENSNQISDELPLNISSINEQYIPSQLSNPNDEQQPDDEISLEKSTANEQEPLVTPEADEQQLTDELPLESSVSNDQEITIPVVPDLGDQQQPDDEISLEKSTANEQEPLVTPEADEQQLTDELPLESSVSNDQEITTPVVPDLGNQQQQNNDLLSVPSTKAQDYILENIVTPLDQRRVDVDRLEVNLDGKNIFKMNDGNVANSKVTDSQAELIKQALNDPSSFKGTVKITNGKQVLLHVKDGQVLRDGLNLTKSTTKIEISSSSSDSYNKYSQGLPNQGLKTTKQVAINALSDGIPTEQVKDMIKSQDPGYQTLVASSNENAAKNSLDKIISSASAEVNKQNSQSNSENLRKTPALSR